MSKAKKRPPRETLEQLLKAEMSHKAIALCYGVNVEVVYTWLVKYGFREKKVRVNGPCKCLKCEKAHREKVGELTALVCGDEACFMRCDECEAGFRMRCDKKGVAV